MFSISPAEHQPLDLRLKSGRRACNRPAREKFDAIIVVRIVATRLMDNAPRPPAQACASRRPPPGVGQTAR